MGIIPEVLHLFSIISGKEVKKFSIKNVEKRRNVWVLFPFEGDSANVFLFHQPVEVADEVQKRSVRQRFLRLIEDKGLSSNVLSALGYSPRDPIEALLKETHNSVWKLEGVKVNEIMGLKNQDIQQYTLKIFKNLKSSRLMEIKGGGSLRARGIGNRWKRCMDRKAPID